MYKFTEMTNEITKNRFMRDSAKLRYDIIDLCKLIPHNSNGIEVGCFKGESSELFALSGKFKKLYCVDPWEQGYYKQHDMGEVEGYFDQVASKYPVIIKLKKYSSVLRDFIELPVNFIYIDANHNYEFVKKDIINALEVLDKSPSNLPKILAGHDYKFPKSPGVEKAVKELLNYPDVRFAGYSWVKFIR
jgi:hypothetical protein